jgi:L-asparaginase
VRTVAVLCTGGTIASLAVPGGGSRASLSARDLLDRVSVPDGVRADGRDIRRLNSFALTPEDMRAVLEEVRTALGEPGVDGVVVTHGTDAMEETSFFVDLFHADERPVVFTGAQRAADAVNPDGPANLRDAIAVAADPRARGGGVLVVCDGSVFAARGVRKVHTLASGVFGDPDAGALGGLAGGRLHLFRRTARATPLNPAALSSPLPRVDVVAVYPGSDGTAIAAFAAAGARGLVLQATGAGNATPAVVAAVGHLTARGAPVVVSTRVPAGPVIPLYSGDGGGVDLAAAGAIPAGRLRPGQARMLLIALLATGVGPEDIRRAFAAC